MTNEKEILKNSVEILVETAADAAALAKEQRVTADAQNDTAIQQHATAHKLEHLSEALAQGAAELKESMMKAAK